MLSIEEIEKIRLNLRKTGFLSDVFSKRIYDFCGVDLSDEFLDFFLNDKFMKELNKIRNESDKQDKIIEDAIKCVSIRYPKCHILLYNCKVVYYTNYYLVKIVGNPFEEVYLIYDKKGKMLDFVSKSDGSISIVDDQNYFILDNNNNACHKQIDCISSKSKRRNNIRNVYSGIMSVFGNLISCKMDINLEKGILYNYKNCELVVPEYTMVESDYGLFDYFIACKDFYRIINSISYNNIDCNLEFLVDDDGILCTDVYDFTRNICYDKEKYEGSQLEVLNSIYIDAMNHLISESDKNKGYSRVRKNNM